MRPAAFSIIGLLVVTQTGCGSDQSCTVSEDCFQGEVCVDRVCSPRESTDGGDPDGGRPDGDDPDGGRSDAANNGSALECVVDPIGLACEADSFEPNEMTFTTGAPLLWDNQSWCTEGTLLESQTSEPLSLCAGDERDVFRLMIDNRSPDECITRQFTWKVEVRVETACEPGLLHVEPYFGDPATEDRCSNDDDFRCSWSGDGQTFTVEQLRQPDQLMDLLLLVEPADGRDDLQIEYDVVMTVIQ